MSEDGLTRRKFLGAAAAGTATLAGCSTNNGDGSPGSNPSNTETTEDTSETVQNTTEGDTQQNTQTDNGTEQSSSQDQVHTGEEELENYMSSVVEDGDGALGEVEYHWMEFEQVEESLDLNFPEEMEYTDLENNMDWLRAQSEAGYDTAYFALNESGGDETEFIAAFLVADDWDTDLTVAENATNQAFYTAGFNQESEEHLQTLFDENVLSYDDVSEGFPQEYLDLVEE